MEKIVQKVMFLFVIRVERAIIYRTRALKDPLVYASIATKRATSVRIAQNLST